MMKNIIVTVITLMPMLVLGQDKAFDKHYILENDKPSVHFLHHGAGDSDLGVETALIDDRKWDRSLLNFDFDKNHSLSYTRENQRGFKIGSSQKSGDELLYEIKPLMDFNVNF